MPHFMSIEDLVYGLVALLLLGYLVIALLRPEEF
jgi:K+-transporting ATPase KdpF subunit